MIAKRPSDRVVVLARGSWEFWPGAPEQKARECLALED